MDHGAVSKRYVPLACLSTSSGMSVLQTVDFSGRHRLKFLVGIDTSFVDPNAYWVISIIRDTHEVRDDMVELGISGSISSPCCCVCGKSSWGRGPFRNGSGSLARGPLVASYTRGSCSHTCSGVTCGSWRSVVTEKTMKGSSLNDACGIGNLSKLRLLC